ncbi:uncharacterized protein [Watersipora subatra]|uniref:uncharacterized protein n=1 Tax=Watersipora subatra TaxID=2589382 RepID=UPI00355C1DD7
MSKDGLEQYIKWLWARYDGEASDDEDDEDDEDDYDEIKYYLEEAGEVLGQLDDIDEKEKLLAELKQKLNSLPEEKNTTLESLEKDRHYLEETLKDKYDINLDKDDLQYFVDPNELRELEDLREKIKIRKLKKDVEEKERLIVDLEKKLEECKERQERVCVVDIMQISEGEKQHYCWIKNMSRLLSAQKKNHKKAVHICYNCMNLRRTKEALINHQKWCLENDSLAIRFPNAADKIKFKNYNHSMRVPFAIYGDFESYLRRVHSCDPSPDESYTNTQQHHKPMGFDFQIVTSIGEKHDKIIYLAKNDDEVENIGEVFVREVEKEVKKLYANHKFKKPLSEIERNKHKQEYEEATHCHICKKELSGDKVLDHCHLTGNYRGAAHNKCNLDYRIPKFYPIFFHNLSGYDAHHFVKSLGVDPGKLNCIPINEEKYISFSKKILVDEYLSPDHKCELKRKLLDAFNYRINPRLPNWNEKAKRYIEGVVKELEDLVDENKHYKFWSTLNGIIKSGKSIASQKEIVKELQQDLSDNDEDYKFWSNVIEVMSGDREVEESENFWSYLEEELEDIVLKFKEENNVRVYRELRFLDSYRFMSDSLDNLAGNLRPEDRKQLKRYFSDEKLQLVSRKGVFPYEDFDDLSKLDATELPPKEAFWSELSMKHISDEDYEHAKKVWNEFGIKTFREYLQLYLETDVLHLADVFERFRDICMEIYDLDPACYYTAASLSWDAMLKTTGLEFDPITDPDKLLFFERCVRGGVSMITKRHAKANNKYMKDYDESEPDSFIIYLDANNLYGDAMSRLLPVGDFKWMTDEQLKNWQSMPCMLEVDLEYPKGLHDLHNDYPFCPERKTINGVQKLVPTLENKEHYVIHYSLLKQALEHGLILKKVHRGITFRESDALAKYIDKNTKLRAAAKNNFEIAFFKLMNNVIFGKTMENIRNRSNIKLVSTEDKARELIAQPNYETRTTFNEHLTAVHMKATNLYFDKPMYLGAAILDISKTVMYDFHYNYIKPKYGNRAQLLFTDTDSLMYHIHTKDFYEDIKADVRERFDTSNYPKDHPSGIETGVNKKVIGKFKDEAGGKQITDFVGLRPKLYSYILDGCDDDKCDGTRKSLKERGVAAHVCESVKRKNARVLQELLLNIVLSMMTT